MTSRVPTKIVQTIGAAKSVGRDRWLDLAQLIEKPANLARAEQTIGEQRLLDATTSDGRFELVFEELRRSSRAGRRETTKPTKTKWQPADKGVSGELTDTGKTFALSLKLKDASRFGRYLAANLDKLYGQFKEQESDEERTNVQ